MEKKIDGKIYNTETAHKVAEIKVISDEGYFYTGVYVQAPEEFETGVFAGDTFVYMDFVLSEKRNKIIPTDVNGLIAFEAFVNNEHITAIRFDEIILQKSFDTPDVAYLKRAE